MTSPTFYKFLRSALIAAMLVFMPMYAFADYYVATTGSDSNLGTQSAPFKTILKASQVASPGNTIHVASGTYVGGFQTAVSGTASAHIRYVSDTKWGAKIVPPTSGSVTGAWRNTGSYTDIDGFEINGSVESTSGTVWREGIYQLGSYNTIRNCHIHHIALHVPQPDGYGGAGIVNDNYNGGVSDDVYSSIIHDIGPPTGTQIHGIYQSTNGNVINNLVYNIQDAGLTSWHNANHINFVNNTVFHTGEGVIVGSGDHYGGYTGTNDYTNVSNNILFDNAYGITEQGTTGIHNTYTNNLVYQNGTNWVLKNGLTHTGDVTGDPQFVNYIRTGGGDYHLKSTSPAINKGSSTYAPSTDLDGATRPQGGAFDIGAYEYGGTVTTLPPPPPPPSSASIVSPSATSLNFGSVAVGTASAVQTITITNTGTASLSFPVAFVLTGDFSFGGSGTCSVTTPYAPGTSCTASIQFTPTVSGTRTGTLTITSNAASSPNVISLSGSGVTTTTTGTTLTAAHHLYVATTGSDSNAGTQTSPFKTILKASQVAVADTIVHVASGTYVGGFQTMKSGTASGRIRYLSDTKWGAKIIPPTIGSTGRAWDNLTSSYTDIDGFEIDGTVESTSGTIWRTGILQEGSYNTVTNCHIHHIAKHLPQPDGTGGAGIENDNYFGGVSDDAIGNVVHDIGPPTGTQVHGIYQSTNGKVMNNIVYNTQTVGITSWHNANHINIVNNTVFNCPYGILIGSGDHYNGYTGTNDYSNVSNNIVVDTNYGIVEEGTTGTHNTYTNNLVFRAASYAWGLQNGNTHSGDVNADPQFVNYSLSSGVSTTGFVYSSGDVHLKSTSPAIDKGSATYAPSTDYDGRPRPQGAGYDIGAYEYGGTVTTNPPPPPPPPSSPTVSISPTSLNFGAVPVGTASTEQVITITNTGTANLSFPVAFTMTGDFSFGGTGNCAVGTSYAPGASCTASVKFTPTVSGTRTGTLTITSNAASSPNVVQLSGTGGTVTTTGITTLTNGLVLTSLSGATGATHMYSLTVPSGATNLRFVSSGGAGDLDLYAKFGSQPSTTVYDAKSDGATTAETISIPTPQAGTYYLLTNGWAAYSGVSLVGAYTAAVTSGPVVSLSPTSINFGTVTVGNSSADQIVTIKNTGTTNLTFSGAFTLTGDFAFGANGNCGVGVSYYAPGTSCTASVKFTPTVTGTRTGTLTITDAAGTHYVVSLTGTGGVTVTPAPVVSLSSTSLNFGSVTVGTASTEQIVTITNTGTANLSFPVAFTMSGDFSFGGSGNCAVGTSYAPGAGCTASVKFTPTVSGARTGTLTINSNAAGSPHAISLTGTGGTVTTTGITTLTNGVVLTSLSGATGATHMYSLTVPSGASNLRFVSSGGTGDLDLYAKFGSQPSTTVYDAKSDGATTAETISIPTPQAGTYYLLTNGWAAYSGVSLVGAYTAAVTSGPVVSLSPTSLNFGSVALGSVSTVQTVTITNSGTAGLIFPSSFTFTGDYTFGGTGTCGVGTSYAPGASCTASVKFTPTVSGTRTGTLTITDNAAGSPHVVSLTGTGGTATVTPPGGTTYTASHHLYVATTGSDSNLGTQSAPFRTISKAGSVAVADTIVHVAPGTYNENVVTNTSGTASGYITYLSDTKWGAKVVAGSALHSFAFAVWGNYTRVIGFDVTGGGAIGIYMARSFGEARNNYVHDIPAPGNDGFGGAGIDFGEYGYTNGIADSNTIARIGHYNSAGYNNSIQGLYAAIPNVTLSNNIVYGVLAFGINTGHDSTNCVMANNVIFGNGNISLDSGGIVITGNDSAYPVSNGHRVRNNIVFDNMGHGIHEEGTQGSDIIYSNNLVFQNSSGDFWLMNGHSSINNVSADPQFVNYIKTGGGDYHLKTTSPAINTGTSLNAPTTDMDGITRPQGGGYDIGAYEYGGTVTTTPPPPPPSSPIVSLSPTSLNFGSVTVGTASTEQIVTITNTGTAALSFPVVFTMSGDFSFGVSGNCSVGTSYAPGASCTASVKFTPTVSGTRTGTLTITDNAANSPQAVQLTGTGGTTTTTPPGGTTYTAAHYLYVSTTGSDSNPGTQSAPFRTITKAGSVAVPDTIVHVAPGTYNEDVVTNTSGTASGYITYLSDVKWGAKVVAGSAYHGMAFKVWGNYTKVIGFDITGGGSDGLYMGRSFGEARNNYVHDVPAPGNDGHGGAGINFAEYGYTNGIADSNVVARIGTYVASCGSGCNNKVHGLYAAIPNITFSNNIVYGSNAYAINTGHFSINCIMVNNILIGNGNPLLDSGGIVITATDSTSPISNGHRIRNNIIFDNLGTGIHEEGSQGSDTIYSNNLVFQNSSANFGQLNGHSNTNNVAANPLFVNYVRSGSGDYHLQSTSPAVNSGVSTNAPTKDLDGVARPQGAGFDIGAYER